MFARILFSACLLLFNLPTLSGQQSGQEPAPPAAGGIADFARQQRANNQTGEASPGSAPDQPQKSMAELAAERKSKREAEIKVTEKDTESLFQEMDQILQFASQDSGLPRKTAVKGRLVSQADVKSHMSASLAGTDEARRAARSEVVLKKFGYLPPAFNLKSYLVDAAGQSIAGYYDPRNKTMHLLSWVGLEEQRPIMAHELTHALQDQNYDLMKWALRPEPPPSMHVSSDEGQDSTSRRAVVEGQAMIVYYDYTLQPYGRSLSNTPEAIEFLKGGMAGSYESLVSIRGAPLFMKEVALFPYREGLLFELELLRKGGTQMAFAEPFAHPPLSTHQILEPRSYIEGEKISPVTLPDLSSILSGEYEVYDSGAMGQLDVRILTQLLGTENDMFTVTPGWRGGAYIAVKRKNSSAGPDAPVSTADVALLYVSKWKTAEAAQRFFEVYRDSLPKRVRVMGNAVASPGCTPAACSTRVDTGEGPVFLELLPDHTLLIAQSFPEATMKMLRRSALTSEPGKTRLAEAPELSLKLMELPAFQNIQQQVYRELINRLSGNH